MEVSNVSYDDGRACAQLLAFIKSARWELTGSDIDELVKVKRWVGELAGKMGANLRTPQQAPSSLSPSPSAESPAPAMKIKAMGPIGAPAMKPKSRKK